jgi:hypothetical protein
MKPRTVTALLCAAALGSPGLLAHASAAPVEQRRLAATDLRLPLRGGAYLAIELRIHTAASGSTLTVNTMRCNAAGCSSPQDYAGAVSGATISASEARATLRTTLGGRAVSISWTPNGATGAGPAVVLGGMRGSGNGEEDDASVYTGTPADVTVQLGSASCAGTGAVGDEVHVTDTSGRPAGVLPLSQLRLPAGTPIC